MEFEMITKNFLNEECFNYPLFKRFIKKPPYPRALETKYLHKNNSKYFNILFSRNPYKLFYVYFTSRKVS